MYWSLKKVRSYYFPIMCEACRLKIIYEIIMKKQLPHNISNLYW